MIMCKKDLSASSSHTTRKHKSNCSSGEVWKILLVVLLAEFCAWVYQTAVPPPPRKLGPPDGLPLTSPRIQLSDGRHLSYKEHGVSKEVAKSKIIYVTALIAAKKPPGHKDSAGVERVSDHKKTKGSAEGT
ncbi:hypothetical protein R6Q57_013265 [Mikania cordata]